MPRQTNWHTPCGHNCSHGVDGIGGFSAACWYFGKGLADDPALAGVPIGLVGTFVGGTYIEQWIQNKSSGDCQQTLCSPGPRKQKWCYQAGTLYSGNIAPFINQTVQGFVWYRPIYPCV